MTQEELTDINALFGGLSDDNNTNANNYDIIIRNQTSGNAMKVPLAIFKQVVYNYLTSASVAAGLASVLGAMKEKQINNETDLDTLKTTGLYSWVNMASKPQNTPSNVAGGFCVVLSGSSFYRQMVFDGYYGDRDIYTRTTHSENLWSAWKKITTTSV